MLTVLRSGLCSSLSKVRTARPRNAEIRPRHCAAAAPSFPPSMSENRETSRAAEPIFRGMDMDFEACRRAFQTRDARFDGRIFGAVKTTGIYCRPICPGAHAQARRT